MKFNRIITAMIALVLTTMISGCTSTDNNDGDFENSTTGSNVPVTSTVSGSSENDSSVSGSDTNANNNTTLDEYVSETIISYNKNNFRDGEAQMFATEYHETLKTVDQEDSIVVYLVVLYAQYQYLDGVIELTGSSCVPVSITFSKNNNDYTMTEYWEPEDGEYYEQSVKDKFPPDITDEALSLLESDGMNICDQKAKEYFEGTSN